MNRESVFQYYTSKAAQWAAWTDSQKTERENWIDVVLMELLGNQVGLDADADEETRWKIQAYMMRRDILFENAQNCYQLEYGTIEEQEAQLDYLWRKLNPKEPNPKAGCSLVVFGLSLLFMYSVSTVL